MVLSQESTITCYQKQLNQKIEIQSACKLPTGMDGIRKNVYDAERSTVKIFQGDLLISSKSASCKGIDIEDGIVFSINFETDENFYRYNVIDDMGANDYKLSLDTGNIDDQDNFIEIENCNVL